MTKLQIKLGGLSRLKIMEIAESLQVDESTVYRWKNGKAFPRIKVVNQLLEIFPELVFGDCYEVDGKGGEA